MSSINLNVLDEIVARVEVGELAKACCAMLYGDQRNYDLLLPLVHHVLARTERAMPDFAEVLSLRPMVLVPNEDTTSKVTSSSVICHVPQRCFYSGVSSLTDKRRLKKFLGIDKHPEAVASLKHALADYARNVVEDGGTITCAVYPYPDAVLIPAILFALHDDLTPLVSVKFVGTDWRDMNHAMRTGEFDIGYTSVEGETVQQTQRNAETKTFAFASTKDHPITVPLLTRANMISPQARPLGQRLKLRAQNFTSNYVRNGGDYETASGLVAGTNAHIDLYPASCAADNEARTIMAVARGVTEVDTIIPTHHGFMWAVEAGLVRPPSGGEKLGCLVAGKVNSPQEIVGFGVRKGEGDDFFAKRLLKELVKFEEEATTTLLNGMIQSPSEGARIVVSILKAVMCSAHDGYAAILDRLDPELSASAAIRGASWYMAQWEYQPKWWKSLSPEFSSPTGMDPQNAKPDTIQNLRA